MQQNILSEETDDDTEDNLANGDLVATQERETKQIENLLKMVQDQQ